MECLKCEGSGWDDLDAYSHEMWVSLRRWRKNGETEMPIACDECEGQGEINTSERQR